MGQREDTGITNLYLEVLITITAFQKSIGFYKHLNIHDILYKKVIK